MKFKFIWGFPGGVVVKNLPCWTGDASSIPGLGWSHTAAAAPKSLQSCPTLCDPIDGSPPGSAVPGILQARTLEWVAISFSNPWKWKGIVKSLRPVRLLTTPWTAAHQTPPSMGCSKQERWSGLPLPSPKPRSHNYWTCAPEHGSYRSWAMRRTAKGCPP